MKRLNLIPKKTKPGQPFAAGRSLFKRSRYNAIFIVVILLAIFIILPNFLNQQGQAKLASAKKQLDAAKAQLSHLQTKQLSLSKDYDVLLKQKGSVDARLEYLKSAKMAKPGELSQALVYLPTLIPEEIWINKLSIGREGVVINGSTLDNQAVSRFMDNLNKSSKFKGSNFNFTKKNEIGDSTLYNFEIATNLVE